MTYDATLSRQAHPFVERGRRWRAVRHQRPVRERRQHAAVRARRRPGLLRPAVTPSATGSGRSSSFPPIMHPAFDAVDEVWTATDFVAEAVRAVGAQAGLHDSVAGAGAAVFAPAITREPLRPARPLHVPLRLRLSQRRRAQEPARPDRGVHARLRARRRARPGDQEHQRRAAPGRARTGARRGRRSAGHRGSSTATTPTRRRTRCSVLCDCYVSLHRSEGLGLTMAEAMALGKPVIATGYSGNLHFMTPENSYLVDFARVRCRAGANRIRRRRPGPTPTSIRRQVISGRFSNGLRKPRGGRARGNGIFSSATIARRRRAPSPRACRPFAASVAAASSVYQARR